MKNPAEENSVCDHNLALLESINSKKYTEFESLHEDQQQAIFCCH